MSNWNRFTRQRQPRKLRMLCTVRGVDSLECRRPLPVTEISCSQANFGKSYSRSPRYNCECLPPTILRQMEHLSDSTKHSLRPSDTMSMLNNQIGRVT